MGAVTEDNTEAREVNHPCIELVEATPSTTALTYSCKKLANIDGALISNLTTDDQDFRVSWSGNVVTLDPEDATDADKFYLILFGRK